MRATDPYREETIQCVTIKIVWVSGNVRKWVDEIGIYTCRLGSSFDGVVNEKRKCIKIPKKNAETHSTSSKAAAIGGESTY